HRIVRAELVPQSQVMAPRVAIQALDMQVNEPDVLLELEAIQDLRFALITRAAAEESETAQPRVDRDGLAWACDGEGDIEDGLRNEARNRRGSHVLDVDRLWRAGRLHRGRELRERGRPFGRWIREPDNPANQTEIGGAHGCGRKSVA